ARSSTEIADEVDKGPKLLGGVGHADREKSDLTRRVGGSRCVARLNITRTLHPFLEVGVRRDVAAIGVETSRIPLVQATLKISERREVRGDSRAIAHLRFQ